MTHLPGILRNCYKRDELLEEPVIRLEKNSYSAGDTLRANCSSPPSSPPANVTWYLNGEEASHLIGKAYYSLDETNTTSISKKEDHMYLCKSQASRFSTELRHEWTDDRQRHDFQKVLSSPNKPWKNEEASSLQHHGNTSDTVTTASLTVELSAARFPGGKLRLRCVADLFSISRTVRELWLDEDRPRLASVLGNKNSAAAGASSFTCLLQMALMAAVIHSR
ncbi:hypothetical protein J6590_082507 [Homalodisca vitripennis]|nr:hypothetical protein J6590_082507 [Homalodisca vitripennis]